MKNFNAFCVGIMITVFDGAMSAQAAESDGLKLLLFRFAQASLNQTDGGFYTGGIGWSPRYRFGDFGIRLGLNGTYVKPLLGEMSAVGEAMGYGPTVVDL